MEEIGVKYKESYITYNIYSPVIFTMNSHRRHTLYYNDVKAHVIIHKYVVSSSFNIKHEDNVKNFIGNLRFSYFIAYTMEYRSTK